MAKLTKRTVDSIRATDKEAFVWDDEIPGFGLRVQPSGRKSYLVQYRAKGRTRRLTIGVHGVLTPEAARTHGRKLLASVIEGGDPSEERRQTRKAETVAELCERYLKEHAEPHKKGSSLRNDRQLIEDVICKSFGTRKVADLTFADVQRMHSASIATPYRANRALACLSKMMTLAVRWGLRRDNPCSGVERFKEEKRQRFLSTLEVTKLGEVLAAVERERINVVDRRSADLPSVVPAIRLLVLTGARLGEILTLRWDYVDLERRCLHLPDSKTGAKVIHLNPAALQVLAGLPRDESGWVLPGRRNAKCLANLEKPWGRIRKRAGIEDVRLHDLRHTFASTGAGMGTSLPMIGALLGHTQPSTTARYAHLAADPLKEATDRIGARLASLLGATSETPDNKVELQRQAG